jgi:hypothetical protein
VNTLFDRKKSKESKESKEKKEKAERKERHTASSAITIIQFFSQCLGPTGILYDTLAKDCRNEMTGGLKFDGRLNRRITRRIKCGASFFNQKARLVTPYYNSPPFLHPMMLVTFFGVLHRQNS